MSFRKILVGIFMAGIICCGIGAGVTFQEYSSFKYMGEKRIGSNKIAEKTLTENLYTDKTKKLNTSFIAYNNENENILGIPLKGIDEIINDEDDILLVASKNYSESMMGIAKQMEFKNIIDVSKYI